MKILICSDIHANFEALKTITPFLEYVDMKVCLGDIVGYGCAVNECIDYLRSNQFVCIQGNHERYLIEGTEIQTKFLNESVLFGIDVAKRKITEDNFAWIKSLPVSLGLIERNRRLLFVHGSPFDPIDEYIYPNTFDSSKFKLLRYDFIALGHTHRELDYKYINQTVFNSGSIGQARDYEGKACFAILNLENGKLERHRIPYDYSAHLELSRKNGGKEWIYKHFQNINKEQKI